MSGYISMIKPLVAPALITGAMTYFIAPIALPMMPSSLGKGLSLSILVSIYAGAAIPIAKAIMPYA